MITLKQESTLIESLKSLTELELQSVFEELAGHIYKYNLSEAVQQALDVHDFRSEILELEDDIENLKEDKYDYKSKCERAVDALEDLEESLKNIKSDFYKDVKIIIEILSENSDL